MELQVEGEAELKVEERELGVTFEDLLKVLPEEKRGQISSSEVVILPMNFADLEKINEQPFRDRSIQVYKLLRDGNVKTELFEGEKSRPELELRAFDLLMPTVMFLVTDPTVRSVVINIISQIIYDGLKFLSKKDKKRTPLELEFVKVSPDGTMTSVKYEGTAEDFAEISEKLKAL